MKNRSNSDILSLQVNRIQKKGFWFPKSLLYKESRTLDMNKLRMTGFECFATFVIRCAKHTPKGAARHWQQELCLGIEIN